MLAGPEKFTGTANRKIGLGDREAVRRGEQSIQPRLAVFADPACDADTRTFAVAAPDATTSSGLVTPILVYWQHRNQQVPESEETALETLITDRYPNITAIRVRAALRSVNELLSNISLAVGAPVGGNSRGNSSVPMRMR